MLSGPADVSYVRACLIRTLQGVSEVAAGLKLGGCDWVLAERILCDSHRMVLPIPGWACGRNAVPAFGICPVCTLQLSPSIEFGVVTWCAGMAAIVLHSFGCWHGN